VLPLGGGFPTQRGRRAGTYPPRGRIFQKDMWLAGIAVMDRACGSAVCWWRRAASSMIATPTTTTRPILWRSRASVTCRALPAGYQRLSVFGTTPASSKATISTSICGNPSMSSTQKRHASRERCLSDSMPGSSAEQPCAIRRFIEYAHQYPDVWFTTREKLARAWLAMHP